MTRAVERIYLRAPNWVGDFVMSTPIQEAIRAAFPSAHITLGLRPHLEAVVRGLHSHDELHLHPRGLRWGGLRALARDLASRRFDLAIVLPNSFETALVAALARIPRRVGYAMNGRGWLLTDRIRPPSRGLRRVPNPMPIFWSELVRLAGVEVASIRPRLSVDDATIASFDEWLQRRGVGRDDRVLLAAPGASFGSSKLWPPHLFAAAIDGIARELGTIAVIQFGPGEEPLARDIAERCRSRVVLADDPPLDLHRLKAAARRCDLLLCTDSGVRHYGVAFDRPVVCVMGPNDPRYTAANLDKTIVVQEDVDCGPCQLKACPLDHRCMEQLAPSRVVAEAVDLFRRVGGAAPVSAMDATPRGR